MMNEIRNVNVTAYGVLSVVPDGGTEAYLGGIFRKVQRTVERGRVRELFSRRARLWKDARSLIPDSPQARVTDAHVWKITRA